MGKFSPDGHWLAYTSDESGHYEVYVNTFPGPGGKLQISTGGGRYPRWRKDGKELFYVTANGQLMAQEIQARDKALETGRVQKLFDGVRVTVTRNYPYDAAPDGQKFIVIEENTLGAPPLTLVQNWTAALRK